MINSLELTGSTEYLMLYMRFRVKRCCYNRVRLYFYSTFCTGKLTVAERSGSMNEVKFNMRFRIRRSVQKMNIVTNKCCRAYSWNIYNEYRGVPIC